MEANDPRTSLKREIETFASSVARMDVADLAAAVGALGLVPQNSSHVLRLDLMAAIAIAVAPSGRQRVSRSRLSAMFKHPPLSSVAHLEDPCDGFLTECVAFYGGSYLLFPGNTEDATFSVRSLARALFAPVDPALSVRDELQQLFGGVLALSDFVARRAGLSRYAQPTTPSPKSVYVPSNDVMHQLMQAVRLPKTDVEAVLRGRGFDPHALDVVITRPGAITTDDAADIENPAFGKAPVLEVGEELIVISPSALICALRYHVLRITLEAGEIALLSDRCRNTMLEITKSCLQNFRLEEIPEPRLTASDGIDEAFFQLDTDKVLHLQVLTDPLDDLSTEQLFDTWQADATVERSLARSVEVEAELRSVNEGLTDVLHLTAFVMMGRQAFLGFPREDVLSLALGVADLETLSLLEGSDPLFLLKFAKARNRLRAEVEVITFDPMNEIGMYRAKDHSFYLSDESRPTALMISEGFKGDLHREMRTKRDPHPVQLMHTNVTVDVMRLHDDTVIPIYVPFPFIGTDAQFLVEGELAIWISVKHPAWEHVSDPSRLAFQCGEMLAFWTWQFSEVLAHLRQARRSLLIAVEFGNDEETSSPFVVRVEGRQLRVTFHKAFERANFIADNALERDLIRRVLQTAFSSSGMPLDASELTDSIEAIAPLGQKRMMASFDMAHRPQLDRGLLPAPRHVQVPDLHTIDDSFEEWVAKPLGLGHGAIADEDRTRILNHFVDACFMRLREKVSRFQRDAVIEWCVIANESLIRQRTLHEATLATQVACYGPYKDLAAEIARLRSVHRGSEIAARFLVEFAASEEWTGASAMSTGAYDELLALAYSIVNRGVESDLIHFGVTDFKMSVLASGRVGADRTGYQGAMDQFLAQSALLDLRRGMRSYASQWSTPSDTSVEPALEDAFRAEFGLTATQLHEFYWALYRIGADISGEYKSLPFGEVAAQLVRELGQPLATVEEMLNDLSLLSRKSFEEPPPGCSKSDLWPWRFNRALSYLRRPLVRAESSGLLGWGNRNLMDSMYYLGDLVTSGRIKSRSNEMRTYVNTIRQQANEQFNDDVADAFEGRKGAIVRRRLTKVGDERIVDDSGNDLGDVDVLAAFPGHRRLFVVECKDFGGARTAAELHNELEEVFGGGTKRSTSEKHKARVDWIEGHLSKVLESLHLAGGRWRVGGMIVVDQELLSPFLIKTAFPVVPFANLDGWLQRNHPGI